jgi:tetratricopeptide (TPR) repeat protein
MIRLGEILVAVTFSLFFVTSCHPKNSKTARELSFLLARQSDTLLREGKLDRGQILIDKALQLYPNNYIAFNNRAYIKIQQNKPEQSVIADLTRAIAIWPEYDIGLYSLANYYVTINDYENTIKISSRYLALQLTKNLNQRMVQHIHLIIGESEKNLLQFDKAIIDLKKALEINPDDKVSHKELAECYYYGREHCERNNKPPLTKQAVRDSINAEKFDKSHAARPSIQYSELEKARRSRDIETINASAFYDSIIAMFTPNKIRQQKVIDNLTQAFQIIHNDNNAAIDTKYLQKLTNDATANNKILLQKINKIQEVDSTINCKKKLLDYENLFEDFMVNAIPELLKILDQKHDNDRGIKGVKLLQPILLLIRQKGVEFYNAEEALMNKYSLH